MRVTTPFELVEDLISIDAVVAGPARRGRVTLILDTGSVATTIVPAVAAAIGFTEAHSIRRSVTRTAAAEERGYIVAAGVSALGYTASKLGIVVADLGYDIDGVLGFDFLRHFNVEIRPAEQLILAAPIAP